MTRLALVSDTHVPSRARRIPDWARTRVRRADHVVHAGDFDSADALASVRELADGDLTAVAGNTDPAALDLPEIATLDVAGVTFVVTHGTGPARGYRERVAETVRREAGDAAVGVSGHTHEMLNERVDGVRLLNPGSATGAAPADRATMMTATVEDGAVTVQTHEG
ncbi:metallophosphoesterase family protein [Halomicrococcus sp. NG-SE-24]|uniref:metallophosphoesterase family protein n=1 Tax=Halomicrococcus sp. NG-SE-24 TaxID=3436928 RepID=UPI003D96627C